MNLDAQEVINALQRECGTLLSRAIVAETQVKTLGARVAKLEADAEPKEPTD